VQAIGNVGPLNALAALLGALMIYKICVTIYRLYFHPLSGYPGPKLAASTRLWYTYNMDKGNLGMIISKLHEKYGPVVRIAPDELCYTSSTAWQNIYGFRQHGKPEMAKDTPFYKSPSVVGSIISASRDKHAHMRKLMSRGFSDAALREQQPLVIDYVNLLMKRLHEETDKGNPVEMVSWFNFLTFDVIGDLAFGEPFGCLKDSNYHPWVKIIFTHIKYVNFCQAWGYYPSIQRLIPYITPKSLRKTSAFHQSMTREKTLRRQQSKVDRADFVSNIVKPDSGLTERELFSNTSTLIVAGSETTATLLSAVTWFLCRNPKAMSKLVQEVRSSFQDASEINFTSASKLKYLLACLNEALRCFPPAPTGLARKVPEGGDTIDGKFVAEGTQVSVWQIAANQSTRNWARPFEFIPERWLDDPEFASDDRAAMQPFSIGPRNCIGKNLANVEMRLVLARLLWEFDIQLCEGMENWNQCKIFSIFEKKPLMVKLVAR